MYCRGHNIRIKIVEQFEVIPLGRFKLLNGQTVISDAGNMDIIDEYTIFDCIDKNNPEHHESIFCGKYVAEDLCSLSGCMLPPLFNPLKTINKGGSSGGTAVQQDTWNKTRKQLYNIVMIMIIYFKNINPEKPLFKIKLELEQNANQFPKLYLVKSVNTIIKHSGKSFSTILSILSKNNNLRDFKYNLILDILRENKIQQYLED